MQRRALATLITAALAACGSSGSGTVSSFLLVSTASSGATAMWPIAIVVQ